MKRFGVEEIHFERFEYCILGVGYAEAHAMVYDLEVSAQLQLPAGTNTSIVCSPIDPENV